MNSNTRQRLVDYYQRTCRKEKRAPRLTSAPVPKNLRQLCEKITVSSALLRICSLVSHPISASTELVNFRP